MWTQGSKENKSKMKKVKRKERKSKTLIKKWVRMKEEWIEWV